MREKIYLILFGTISGLLILAAAYPILKQFTSHVPEGASFADLKDFQTTMLQHDARDLKGDQSVSLRSIIAPHPSPLIMYDLLPNLAVKFQRVTLQTNSCGMRSLERSVYKPADVFRIALLGDSFAFGWGVEQKLTFAQVTEDLLNQWAEGKVKVEVLNFGVPGYSTFQEVALFEKRGLDFKPDAVLVYFVDNDFGLPFFIGDVKQAGRMVDAKTFSRSVWSGKNELATQELKRLQTLLDPNSAIRRLVELSEQHGFTIHFAINPRKKWQKDRSRLWILRENPQIRFIPLARNFKEIVKNRLIDPNSLRLPRDPHPNDAKHGMLAEVLAAHLWPEISRQF